MFLKPKLPAPQWFIDGMKGHNAEASKYMLEQVGATMEELEKKIKKEGNKRLLGELISHAWEHRDYASMEAMEVAVDCKIKQFKALRDALWAQLRAEFAVANQLNFALADHLKYDERGKSIVLLESGQNRKEQMKEKVTKEMSQMLKHLGIDAEIQIKDMTDE